MGQLFNRISSGRYDQQTSSIIIENNTTIKPILPKRKCIEQDKFSKRRKIYTNNDDLSFSNRSSIHHSFSSMIIFKCQLCYQCFSSKDSYLEHMVICAIEHHASIRIVRAKQT